MHEGYSGKSTAEIVGITYRQLDYWARTDLIRPSLADAAGSGSRRRYSYRNLLEPQLHTGSDALKAKELLPGFSMTIDEIFEI